jgi:arsenite-transporting ATPase
MDVVEFCRASRVVIVAGKGGVGKTTVTAALASMAASAGLDTIVVDLDRRGGAAASLGYPSALTYEEVVVAEGKGGGRIRARTLTPDGALLEYLSEHGLRRMAKRLVSTGVVEVVATAVPGIKDILVLGKVRQMEQAEVADLIVLDAPAAGHALSFLASAHGLVDAARTGPIQAQAAAVIELLSDPARCQVLLVTLAEETPVNEVVETAYALEDRIGVGLGPVVVNALYPPLDGLDADLAAAEREAGVELAPAERAVLREAAAFRLGRIRLQEGQLDRLREALPLPQIRLPFLFTSAIGPPEVHRLADALAAAVGALAAPAPR